MAAMMLPMMALVVMAPSASAAGSVPEGYRRVAQVHGIPSALFYAVALAESGKRIDGLRTLRPWPWTLNVHGDGRFYASRRAAVAALQEALASGRSSVDIGLMQVNWRYHGAARGRIEDALEPVTSRGRKLFHDALDSRISQSHSISCASCHPDGRNDNQTWQFTFGPRNTPQLGGGIIETAPFHWPGDVTTARDLNSLTVQAFMGGTGLDNDSMDAIASFIDTIRAAPTPAALQPMMTDAQLRGQMVFDSAATGCTECHSGPHFTDNVNWDLGTQSNNNDRRDFQTPVLHGLSRTGPYLHDGSADTLQQLVDRVIRTDRMGTGSHLTDQEASDLVEYLKTL